MADTEKDSCPRTGAFSRLSVPGGELPAVDRGSFHDTRMEELARLASRAGVVRASDSHRATNRAIERITEEHQTVVTPPSEPVEH